MTTTSGGNKINLKSTKITKVGQEIQSLFSRVYFLDISHNPIVVFPELAVWHELLFLVANHCLLASLDPGFFFLIFLNFYFFYLLDLFIDLFWCNIFLK